MQSARLERPRTPSTKPANALEHSKKLLKAPESTLESEVSQNPEATLSCNPVDTGGAESLWRGARPSGQRTRGAAHGAELFELHGRGVEVVPRDLPREDKWAN